MPPPAEGIAPRLVLGPAMRAQPDGRLVALVREGYELAFEEIVRRYRRPLGRFAASIVGSHSEDVTQDAFSKALTALRRDDAEIELRPWLYRIVRNTALNDLRDRPAAAEELAETIAAGTTTAEAAEQREQLAELIRDLRALPETQRAAIVMRELEGLGHDEIAAALGLSGAAARQAIYRARRAIRGGLGLLVPLPVLRALLTGGGGAAEATAGVGGAAAAGTALKATAATMLVAGAVGAGVAIEHVSRRGAADTSAAVARQGSGTDVPGEGGAGSGASRSRSAAPQNREGGGDARTGERPAVPSSRLALGEGGERGDRGEGSTRSGQGGGRGGLDDHGGHGPDGGATLSPSNSGPGSRSAGDGGGSSDLSGGGHSGPGSGEETSSGSSGPGGGGSVDDDPSGSSVSGDGGSGSSVDSGSTGDSSSTGDNSIVDLSTVDNSGPGSLDSGDSRADDGLTH